MCSSDLCAGVCVCAGLRAMVLNLFVCSEAQCGLLAGKKSPVYGKWKEFYFVVKYGEQKLLYYDHENVSPQHAVHVYMYMSSRNVHTCTCTCTCTCMYIYVHVLLS